MTERRVRELKLRAPEVEAARRGAVLFQDALRIASLPGEDRPGRLFVRELDVGEISSRRSSVAVARLLEKALRGAVARGVHIDAPGAAEAPAVFTVDTCEPYVAFLRSLCRGAPLTAWFWRSIVPELSPDAPRATAVVQALVALVEKEEAGRAALAPLLDLLVTDGTADVLLGSLEPGTVARLTRGFVSAHSPSARTVSLALVAPRWRTTLARWVGRWGAEDVRSVWLCALALQARRAVNPSHVEPLARVLARRVVESLEERAPLFDSKTGTPEARVPSRARPEPAAGSEPTRAPSGGRPSALSRDEPPRPEPSPARSRRDQGEARFEVERSLLRWAISERPEPTSAGGLPFLLVVLRRLGVAAFLEAHPVLWELELARRVLTRVAEALRVPADDPLRAAVLPEVSDAPLGRLSYALPSSWQELKSNVSDPRERLFPDDAIFTTRPVEGEVDALVTAWCLAVERWVLTFTELSVRDVVERPASVVASRTHLEVLFDMELCDIRVRRPGLDLDPGYVPWFARVVAYRYLFGGRLA